MFRRIVVVDQLSVVHHSWTSRQDHQTCQACCVTCHVSCRFAVDHELPRSQQVSQSSLDQLRGASGAPSRTHEVVRVRVVLRSHWVIMLPKNGSVVMVSTITHSSSKQISHQGNNFECIRWNLFPMFDIQKQWLCDEILKWTHFWWGLIITSHICYVGCNKPYMPKGSIVV